MSGQSGTFWNRTLTRLRDWRGEDISVVRPLSVAPSLADSDIATIRRQIDACLDGHGGAVTTRLRAAELGRAYLALNDDGKERFFRILAQHYDTDPEAIGAAIESYTSAGDDAARFPAREALRRALVAPRVELLTQFNSLDRGVKFLVDMRADLLRLLRKAPDLAGVEEDLQNLLRGWFDVGFLEMAQITFNAPAALLEKLIAYEAVHAIRSWDDLKNRLDSDRMCFSFVHPNMPDEPLIFVEVALVKGIAGNVAVLLDEATPSMEPEEADTAIFYSISNCQKGLAGVAFGDFLIKRVVSRLSRRLPNVKTFATLSPIPGFRRWLEGELAGEADVLGESEGRMIRAMSRQKTVNAGLKALLDDPRWADEPEIETGLREHMERLAARYLVNAKDGRGRPVDPVARFHLNNGARVERLNWLGDRSPAGMRQSYGMMVNYLYKLDDIEKNHESYRGEGRVVASSRVAKLARSS
ncbi:MAG: malonyl-CoA decarboxylase [Pseudomonadota bacterium]|nr:malonyl-CoA decarboxylase [Pseudomonadota bacterium]